MAALINLGSDWNQNHPNHPIGIGDLGEMGGAPNFNRHPAAGHPNDPSFGWSYYLARQLVNTIHLITDSSTSDLISIFDRVLQTRQRTIFVSMPFGMAKSEDHYAIIERVARELSEANEFRPPLKVERVDWFNDGTSYVITDKINEMISDCGLLIGNLTYSNPNVYHEIGFVMGKAKAEGKGVANILLFLDESVGKKDQAVGFNLRGIKQLRFTKPEGEFARDLRANLMRFFQMKD